jgi:hypothetical protein
VSDDLLNKQRTAFIAGLLAGGLGVLPELDITGNVCTVLGRDGDKFIVTRDLMVCRICRTNGHTIYEVSIVLSHGWLEHAHHAIQELVQ